jgi:hypothetical protein
LVCSRAAIAWRALKIEHQSLCSLTDMPHSGQIRTRSTGRPPPKLNIFLNRVIVGLRILKTVSDAEWFPGMPPAIHVDALTEDYGRLRALDGLTLDLIRPTSGTAAIGGLDPLMIDATGTGPGRAGRDGRGTHRRGVLEIPGAGLAGRPAKEAGPTDLDSGGASPQARRPLPAEPPPSFDRVPLPADCMIAPWTCLEVQCALAFASCRFF